MRVVVFLCSVFSGLHLFDNQIVSITVVDTSILYIVNDAEAAELSFQPSL